VSAGRKAFLDAVQKAAPAVLEPIVHVEINAPGTVMGDITADLATRRARIDGNEARARGRIIVSAYVPLAEVTDYQNRLKALTGGEGSFTLQLSHYDPVPPRKQQELASAWKPGRRRRMNNATPRSDTRIMAVFCDFENVALGVRDAKIPTFDIRKVLERLLLKGNIVVKKAYCNWERYQDFKRGMHEAAFELIEIPHVRQAGKNSADIRLVVDALDLCYTKSHVDTFVIISGDSDFSPLVSKLRENNKIVVGCGVKNSTSDLLISGCDEFIYYDDLVRAEGRAKSARKEKVAKTAPRRRPGPRTAATRALNC
jgi:uncharacterized protein (TIGR00288 family)